ncbi:unnamed protein product [Enterobius vermicularis]|uniref:MADF domain-containing protein n=1 Tax=Enterobius vermicularis TaxID=51028 RepID=A0A0N4V5Y9_ENTVE|nr:unnamed protein product [Enterobius vermicularis]
MVALWNDDARLVLIEEIHKRPEMWDSRRERYASTEQDDVRNQWKNLKDTFKRKMKKRMTDIEAGVEDAEPTWRFWSKMLFIKHDCHNEAPTTTINNMNVEAAACASFESYMTSLHSLVDKPMQEDRTNVFHENGANGSEVRMSTTQPMQNGYHCDGRDLPPNTSLHCPEEVDSLPSQSPLHQPTNSSLVRLRRKGVKRKNFEIDGEAANYSSQTKHDFEDEYTLFGKSVASSLRRLAECAPIDSLRLKKQISDLMFETELQQLLRRQKVETQ